MDAEFDRSYLELLQMIPEEVLPIDADLKTSQTLLKELVETGLLAYMRSYTLVKDVD